MSETLSASTAEHAITYHLAWGRIWAACPCGWEFECMLLAISECAVQLHLKRATPSPLRLRSGWLALRRAGS